MAKKCIHVVGDDHIFVINNLLECEIISSGRIILADGHKLQYGFINRKTGKMRWPDNKPVNIKFRDSHKIKTAWKKCKDEFDDFTLELKRQYRHLKYPGLLVEKIISIKNLQVHV